MIKAPIPYNEIERLNDLYSYHILDTLQEDDFDHLVELASMICQCDMAIINLVDASRTWAKAKRGLNVCEASRELSMCGHTILQNGVMVVEDTLQDSRFVDNPLIHHLEGIRFYAGASIQSEHGYSLGVLCVCDTKPKRLEPYQVEALQRLSRQVAILLELRKKNIELQKIAENEQLLKQKAESAQIAQHQFLSTMSHEIRTPLNGIVGMVDLLQAENLNAAQVEYLNTLKFASENLLNIVNDILDYNKILSGKVSLEEVEFDIHKLINDITKSHLGRATEKGIELLISVDPQIPNLIKADPNRLIQVLHNLVSNAIKFTRRGRVQIALTLKRESEDKATILFEVMDTGKGIATDKQQLIFEQFLQEHDGIAREYGGTGLGLAITKKLLELMGAEIKLKSALNQGSTFYFTLSVGKKQRVLPALPGQHIRLKHFENLKVLIVEDNEVNILVLNKFLQKWGIETGVAHNGMEAIEKIGQSDFHLVLMDMQMPVMDGLTTIKKLRNEFLFKKPVILITADVFVNINNEVTSWGFDDFILKPFKPDDLYAKIKKATRHSMVD